MKTFLCGPGAAGLLCAQLKAEDNVVGVWVRVSQDGQMIGEYTNPPNVTKRGWEQK